MAYFVYPAVSILLIIDGTLTLLMGDRAWRGAVIPAWAAWVEMILGLLFCLLTIKTYRREPKERTYTAEELAQAEAEADALYFREHGQMPQKPPKDEAAPDSQHQGP